MTHEKKVGNVCIFKGAGRVIGIFLYTVSTWKGTLMFALFIIEFDKTFDCLDREIMLETNTNWV